MSSRSLPSPPLAALFGVGPGLGAALARRFAGGGCALALVGRDPALMAALQAELPGCRTWCHDLAQPGAVGELLKGIRDTLGEPSLLIWNASAGRPGGASSLEPGDLEADLRVDLTGPLEAARALLPGMRTAGRGTLLFTGGGLALKAQADLASGSVGKAALRQLALCLAQDLAPEGIHAATVTIRGFIQPGAGPLDPDALAEVFWRLHRQVPGSFQAEAEIGPAAAPSSAAGAAS